MEKIKEFATEKKDTIKKVALGIGGFAVGAIAAVMMTRSEDNFEYYEDVENEEFEPEPQVEEE